MGPPVGLPIKEPTVGLPVQAAISMDAAPRVPLEEVVPEREAGLSLEAPQALPRHNEGPLPADTKGPPLMVGRSKVEEQAHTKRELVASSLPGGRVRPRMAAPMAPINKAVTTQPQGRAITIAAKRQPVHKLANNMDTTKARVIRRVRVVPLQSIRKIKDLIR